MNSWNEKLSTTCHESISGVLSSNVSSAHVCFVADRMDADDDNRMYWQSKIEQAVRFYYSSTVCEILHRCFQQEFTDNGLNTPNRSKLKDTGTILHEYIERFYKKFNNRVKQTIPACDEHVRRMLAALVHKPTQRIKWDRCVDCSDPESEKIHTELLGELVQFYTFVSENQMVLADFEQQILDPKHLVRGRVNAVFRQGDSDKELVLYDWTRSALMEPGSLSLRRKTLQVNIYKYILEKYYDKSIVRMRSVIFHKDKDNYEIIEIEDIDFRCNCPKCQEKNGLNK